MPNPVDALVERVRRAASVKGDEAFMRVDGERRSDPREVPAESPNAAAWNAERAVWESVVRELGEALRAVLGAYEVCDSNRGAFSCHEAHDLRCPKSRAASPAEWRGDWVCACGREELDVALVRAARLLRQEGVRNERH